MKWQSAQLNEMWHAMLNGRKELLHFCCCIFEGTMTSIDEVESRITCTNLYRRRFSVRKRTIYGELQDVGAIQKIGFSAIPRDWWVDIGKRKITRWFLWLHTISPLRREINYALLRWLQVPVPWRYMVFQLGLQIFDLRSRFAEQKLSKCCTLTENSMLLMLEGWISQRSLSFWYKNSHKQSSISRTHPKNY